VVDSIGVRDGGRQPLVLPDFRADLRREADRDAGQLFGQNFAGAPFVGGVRIGVQKAHRDRLRAGTAELAGQGSHRRLVEIDKNAALGRYALSHAEPHMARDQWRGFFQIEVILIKASLVTDLEAVPETFGGNQSAPGAFAFDQRVGGKGRAMNEGRYGPRRHTRVPENAQRAFEEPPFRSVRGGQNLGAGLPSFMVKDDIREGAADIDGQADSDHSNSSSNARRVELRPPKHLRCLSQRPGVHRSSPCRISGSRLESQAQSTWRARNGGRELAGESAKPLSRRHSGRFTSSAITASPLTNGRRLRTRRHACQAWSFVGRKPGS
jgi:hypothetical protein